MLSILLALLASTAHADVDTSKCLDSARVETINSQFKIEITKDKDGTPAVPSLDPCDESTMAYILYQAIMYIEDLPTLAVNADAYDLNIMMDRPYKFFVDHIETIIFDLPTSRACADGNAAAYVNAGAGKIMHICPGNGNSDLLYMVTILLHESRHVDGFPHVMCSHGRWAGMFFGGCDPNYEYHGAYGLETEFNIRLSRTDTIPLEMREGARSLAVITFLENFAEGPFGIRKGLVTQREDGDVSFFDGATSEHLFHLKNSSDLVVMRANLPTVYGLTDGTVSSYLSESEKIETAGSYAKDFRALTPDLRNETLDVLYSQTSSCFLSAKHIRCDDGPKTSELDIKNIRAKSLMVLAGYMAIVDVDGYVYTFDKNLIGSPEFKEENFTRGAQPLDAVSLVVWENKIKFGVNRAGEALRYDITGQPVEPIAELAGARYTKLLGPTWWSAHLADF